MASSSGGVNGPDRDGEPQQQAGNESHPFLLCT